MGLPELLQALNSPEKTCNIANGSMAVGAFKVSRAKVIRPDLRVQIMPRPLIMVAMGSPKALKSQPVTLGNTPVAERH